MPLCHVFLFAGVPYPSFCFAFSETLGLGGRDVEQIKTRSELDLISFGVLLISSEPRSEKCFNTAAGSLK